MPVLTHQNSNVDAPAGDLPDDTVPVTAEAAPGSPSRRRSRWPWMLGGVAVAGGIAAAATLLGDDDPTPEASTAVQPNVVAAETRDLIEFSDLDGRLVFDDLATVTSGADGVITEVISAGDTIERGDTAYSVNAEPVTVFYGDVPFFQPLSEGSTGDDVEILEQNLASLGYHTFEDEDGIVVDTGFVVDGVFDESTTEAVNRWFDDLGLQETGVVEPQNALMVTGPATVTTAHVDLGDPVSSGAPMFDLNTVGSESAVYAAHGGDLELLVDAGEPVTAGDVVYVVDEQPITALVLDEPLDRELSEGVDAGDDVLALEEMLAALGYGSDMDIDDEFDETTTDAVLDWQQDLQNGFELVDVDGIVSSDDVIAISPDTIVGDIATYDSETLASGSVLWSTSSASDQRVVETAVEVSDQSALTLDTTVDVEFPDGTLVPGTVSSVATASTTDPTNPDADPTLAVDITVAEVPESAAGLNEVDVTVKLVDEVAANAIVVPVSALVAVGDGTFAVEAMTTTGTTFVAVDPGMFNDGWVEVSGIQPGTQVVVP